MTYKAKKSYGQHFLKDQNVIKKMIDAADISKSDDILEIGPGTGAITTYLMESGASISAIEADRDLIEPLNAVFPELTLYKGDAIRLHNEITLKDYSYKLVANLPYNIASHIIREYLVQKPRPNKMVLMVQREVADRILAKPGDMGVLSIACQIYGDCKKVVNVKPEAFSPKPRVDSAILSIDLHKKPVKHAEEIIGLAKVGFMSRRKQLKRNLSDAKIASMETIENALEKLNLDPKIRAEKLTIDQWIQLYNELH